MDKLGPATTTIDSTRMHKLAHTHTVRAHFIHAVDAALDFSRHNQGSDVRDYGFQPACVSDGCSWRCEQRKHGDRKHVRCVESNGHSDEVNRGVGAEVLSQHLGAHGVEHGAHDAAEEDICTRGE